MPTGYTAPIVEDDNFTFEDFVMRCARQFGATISMRDESIHTRIPDEFKPSDHHTKRQKELRGRLENLKLMTIEEAQAEADHEKKSEWQAYYETKQERIERKKRLEEMLHKVKQWEPPTEEHEELKKFMENQIQETIDWDCRHPNMPIDDRKDGKEWLEEEIKSVEEDIEYHRKEHMKEKARCEKRTLWIKQLRESIGVL